MGALSVAVASSVFGTGLVSRETGETTICVHLGEVESTVETAREVGDIDVESEFLVLELEHLVGGVGGHEVDTRSDVLAVGVGRDELERQGIATGGDTVGGSVVSAFESAVLGAGDVVGAESSVPGVAGVAVGVLTGSRGVEPAPVGVYEYR